LLFATTYAFHRLPANSKHLDQALLEAQTTVNMVPNAMQTQAALGEILTRLNRLDEANAAFHRAACPRTRPTGYSLARFSSDVDNVGMSILRFLMILSLAVWIGGLIFFAVTAQTAFSVLPSRHLAGSVVGSALGKLHWMALISGILYLASSIAYSKLSAGSVHIFAARHFVLILMLALTVISQWGITPRMGALRASVGEIDNVPPTHPARVQFNRLHVWSEQIEKGVLLLGLVAVYLTASQFN